MAEVFDILMKLGITENVIGALSGISSVLKGRQAGGRRRKAVFLDNRSTTQRRRAVTRHASAGSRFQRPPSRETSNQAGSDKAGAILILIGGIVGTVRAEAYGYGNFVAIPSQISDNNLITVSRSVYGRSLECIMVLCPSPYKEAKFSLSDLLHDRYRNFQNFAVLDCFRTEKKRNSSASVMERISVFTEIGISVIQRRFADECLPIGVVLYGVCRGTTTIFPFREYPKFSCNNVAFESGDKYKCSLGRNQSYFSYICGLLGGVGGFARYFNIAFAGNKQGNRSENEESIKKNEEPVSWPLNKTIIPFAFLATFIVTVACSFISSRTAIFAVSMFGSGWLIAIVWFGLLR